MNPNVITFTLAKKEKAGLILLMLISALLGFGGIYLAGQLSFGGGRFLVLTLGVFFVLVMLFCIVGLFQLHKEDGAGIYISDEGIYDVSTGNSYGTVLWSDVENIVILDDISDLKRKYIVVRVKNPTEYIQREMVKSKRRTLELKLQFYGSPICFSNRALNCTFQELQEGVFFKYNEYKKRTEAKSE
ncbi:hypothetical protein M2480_001926 [Parabacteroides sp. PFB2-12]|uniref:STM3941 family protein n=1 Tax=unclassified Parabacteroides TaxID=2649774 RepID=UPI0024762853|nr:MULTISPECIES: STM3941 family protein [unclassified Parabacteroides]MDH6343461.1 hypothetical protein [Parabacteroides sp. PM6-13]MDH6390939.1 hypothetical protein [Parabacteroides sp. PFB2-12]